VNNRGEYLLTDQAGFDPSVVLREDWKALEPVKPWRDYINPFFLRNAKISVKAWMFCSVEKLP
jgi:hypothetical protein